MKRILAAAPSLVLLSGLVPPAVFAAEGEAGRDGAGDTPGGAAVLGTGSRFIMKNGTAHVNGYTDRYALQGALEFGADSTAISRC